LASYSDFQVNKPHFKVSRKGAKSQRKKGI